MTMHELKDDALVNSKYNFTVMVYPFGKYNKNIERILKKQGYLCAFTFTPDNYATRNSD